MTAETRSGLFVAGGRLRSGWRVSLYLVGYIAGLFATQLPVFLAYGIYLALKGISDPEELRAALQPKGFPLWVFLALKTGEIIILLPATYAMARWLDKRPFADLGFHPCRGWLLELLLGLTLGGVQMATILCVEWAGGWLAVQWLDGAALARGLIDALLNVGLFSMVALGEELMFRGYLQVNLREGIGSLPALLITSLLFGLLHAMNPNLNWIGLINIALAGLALGYGRMVTGSLWLPVAYHFSWDFFQGAVFALPVSGVRYGGLLSVIDRGVAPTITGAAFGPEGGLIGTAVFLSAFPVFWLWGRWRRKTAT